MVRNSLLKAFSLTAICLITVAANAQKLPNKQEVSLLAPANIKIDGKATEWGDRFQAYNTATDIFYTISNDDENLYLTVQVVDPLIIEKIISSGISFKLYEPDKRAGENKICITYPLFDKRNKPNIYLKNIPVITTASKISVDKADSFMNANNKRLVDKLKTIRVTGIAGLDNDISIYNEDGIKAASLFDNKMYYTLELSVKLDLLKFQFDSPFNYNIKLNEIEKGNVNGLTIRDNPGGIPIIDFSPGVLPPPRSQINLFYSATDFWGKYTLAKK